MKAVYKVVMIGNFGVGKTSLVQRFVNNSFSEEYLSTIGVTISKKLTQHSTIMLWDIEGHTEFKPIFKQYLLGAKGFIIVADLTRTKTIDAIEKHVQMCNEIVPNAPICISLNKCDINDVISDEKIASIKALSPLIIDVIKTSAKSGDAVEKLFTSLDETIVAELQK